MATSIKTLEALCGFINEATNSPSTPYTRLRHYVLKGTPVLALDAAQSPLTGDWFIRRGDGRVSREHFANKRQLASFIASGVSPSF